MSIEDKEQTEVVDVMLAAVTAEESALLAEAARTLWRLSELSGRPEHREQSEITSKFATRYGRWEPLYKVAIPKKTDSK